MGWEDLLHKWLEPYGLKGKIVMGIIIVAFLIILIGNTFDSWDKITRHVVPSADDLEYNGTRFVDNEIPMRSSEYLILAHVPNPPDSLRLYMNGMLLFVGPDKDYTISGNMITILYPGTTSIDQFVAFYRY